MRTYVVTTLRHLLESDAKERQLLRKLTLDTTEENLIALLRALRGSYRGLSAIGHWSMGPHEAFLYMRLDDKLMVSFSGSASSQYITNKRGIEILNYRPITRGIHSRLTQKEVDALVAKNKAEIPYRVFSIEPIPDRFLNNTLWWG